MRICVPAATDECFIHGRAAWRNVGSGACQNLILNLIVGTVIMLVVSNFCFEHLHSPLNAVRNRTWYQNRHL